MRKQRRGRYFEKKRKENTKQSTFEMPVVYYNYFGTSSKEDFLW